MPVFISSSHHPRSTVPIGGTVETFHLVVIIRNLNIGGEARGNCPPQINGLPSGNLHILARSLQMVPISLWKERKSQVLG